MKIITIDKAKKAWEKIKNNDFVLCYYSNFDDYWKECQRINNLPENEQNKLLKKIRKMLIKGGKILEEKYNK